MERRQQVNVATKLHRMHTKITKPSVCPSTNMHIPPKRTFLGMGCKNTQDCRMRRCRVGAFVARSAQAGVMVKGMGAITDGQTVKGLICPHAKHSLVLGGSWFRAPVACTVSTVAVLLDVLEYACE